MRDPRVKAAASSLISDYGLDADKLNIKIPQAILIHIASCIKSWSDIAPYLGFDITDFEEVMQKTGNEKRKKLFVLEKWSNKSGKEAKFCKLIEIFLIAGRRDLAERVCDYYTIWNNETSTPTTSPEHKTRNRNGLHHQNTTTTHTPNTHTTTYNGTHTTTHNGLQNLQKCVPQQFDFTAHTHDHQYHPLMYTRKGRPTKRFDLQTANANRLNKTCSEVTPEPVPIFEDVSVRSSSPLTAETASIRVIQIEDDSEIQRRSHSRKCAKRCGKCVYILVLLMFGLLSAASFALAYTIVTPPPHPPSGVTLLPHNTTVLVHRVRPFYTHSAVAYTTGSEVVVRREGESKSSIKTPNCTDSLHTTESSHTRDAMDSIDSLHTKDSSNTTDSLNTNMSVHPEIEFYQVNCVNLATTSTRVRERGKVDVSSEENTHTIYQEYLVKGSTITFHFQFETQNTSTSERTMMTSECATYLNISHEYSYLNYSDFEYKLSLRQPHTAICIQTTTDKQNSSTFLLSVLQSSNYEIKLHFKSTKTSVHESITYDITGKRMEYDVSRYHPMCVTPPTNNSACVFRFSNPYLHRFTEEECILGRNVNGTDGIGIEFWTIGNRYLLIMHYVLVVLGLLFLITCSGFVSGCITMCNYG